MARLALVDRVRSWLGAKAETAGAAASGKRWTLGAAGGRTELALAGAALAAGSPAASSVSHDTSALESLDVPAETTTASSGADAEPSAPGPGNTHLDPLDPDWMQSLPSLEGIGHELEGHRQTSRAIMDAVQRLPELASNQTDLASETNKILSAQSALLESILDGLTSLASAFRTIDESSRRHVAALGQLEASHREVLLEYQAMLLKAHRRLGRLAALAILIAAAALGGVGYVAYLVMVAQ